MMKLLNVIKWGCAILIFINLLIWALYNASGHRVPVETNMFFRNIFFCLLLVLTVTIATRFYLNKKSTRS